MIGMTFSTFQLRRPSRARHDEVRTLEHAEVLHHGAAVEAREGGADLAGRPGPCAQQVEDLAARRMAEGAEDAVLLVEGPYHVI